jgi:nicotinamide-nucleotide amidase
MDRTLLTAAITAIGTELTTGATRDTNSGELAASLTALGLEVLSTSDLPDRLPAVTSALRQALESADLVVSTGGLGPTPDDLTREAIAAACGLDPWVDDELLAWLRGLFARRGISMPAANTKQAWLIDGATALPNAHGSAPGWWVDRPDGRVIVALPGPPREMRPMWHEHVLPRLRQRGAGRERAVETLRLAGIGESALVDLIGEEVLRAREPEVATYARADAVDIVVTATGEGAPQRAAATAADLASRLDQYVFARGAEGWPEALGRLLGSRTLGTLEIGTDGQLLALLGGAAFMRAGELVRSDEPLDHLAAAVREWAGADIGLAVRATELQGDTRVEVALAHAGGSASRQRIAFLAGAEGRRRAALTACALLWEWLRDKEGHD